MGALYEELFKDPSAQGYVINFGTEAEIAAREKQMQNFFIRKFDSARVTFVRGGFWPSPLSELWIVRRGAYPPRDERSMVVDKFGDLKSGELKARVDNLSVQMNSRPNSTAYVLIAATHKKFAQLKSRIARIVALRKYDKKGIRFVRTGNALEPETQMWLVFGALN